MTRLKTDKHCLGTKKGLQKKGNKHEEQELPLCKNHRLEYSVCFHSLFCFLTHSHTHASAHIADGREEPLYCSPGACAKKKKKKGRARCHFLWHTGGPGPNTLAL